MLIPNRWGDYIKVKRPWSLKVFRHCVILSLSFSKLNTFVNGRIYIFNFIFNHKQNSFSRILVLTLTILRTCIISSYGLNKQISSLPTFHMGIPVPVHSALQLLSTFSSRLQFEQFVMKTKYYLTLTITGELLRGAPPRLLQQKNSGVYNILIIIVSCYYHDLLATIHNK